MYQCVKFGINRIKIENLKYPKKTIFSVTSRDEKTVRHTSNQEHTSERALDKERCRLAIFNQIDDIFDVQNSFQNPTFFLI